MDSIYVDDIIHTSTKMHHRNDIEESSANADKVFYASQDRSRDCDIRLSDKTSMESGSIDDSNDTLNSCKEGILKNSDNRIPQGDDMKEPSPQSLAFTSNKEISQSNVIENVKGTGSLPQLEEHKIEVIRKPRQRTRTVSFGTTTEIESTQYEDDPEMYEPPDEPLDDTQLEEEEVDSSYVSLPAELPPPPDGGWGWVIVLVSFLANMTVDGVAYSFSPFLDAFSEYFNEPKGKVAWISSLLAGMYLSVGPIVSSLTNKFGCRPVCILGAIIGAAAYGSSIFAHSVPYLMVTQGVVAGFGFGLIYLPAVVCVGYYFETKRALATGIAVCGSGVGTMLFPPLVNILIENFGWQGANLIIAGIILNACWMGALMRPLEVPKMRKKDLLQRIAEERKHAMQVGSFYGSHYMEVCKSDGTIEKRIRPGKALNFDPGVHSHLSFSEYLTPVPTSNALPTIQEASLAHPNGCSGSNSEESTHGSHDEKDKLVSPTKNQESLVPPQTESPEKNGGLRSNSESIPRNSSQPFMTKRNSVPKRGSVPNFERRPSRMEVFSQLKVIPATPNASYTNLPSLGSQDLKVPGGRYSMDDPEATALRLRRSSKDRKGSVMLPPLSRQDIFYSGSIRNLSEFKSQASILSYRESTFNLQNTSASRAVLEAFEDEFKTEPKEERKCFPGGFCAPVRQMMDFSMLRNPVFLLLGIANMIGMLGFYTPFVYLPGAAIEKGIDKESATFLVSIIGITNTIGRVLAGFIADIPCVNALWVNNVSVFMSGVCVFLTPFAQSFESFIAIAVFFGFFVSPFIALTSVIIVDLMGLADLTTAFGIVCIFRGVAGIVSSPMAAAYISLTSIILVDLLGLESLTSAFGLLILFRGSASLVGPPLAGSIYDATNSYDVSFYSAGALLFLCAFLHSVIPCVQRFCYCAENPVRYQTNEEYLQAIPEEEMDECRSRANSPDGCEGAGIVFDIKPKRGSNRDRASVSSAGSREKVWTQKPDSTGAQV